MATDILRIKTSKAGTIVLKLASFSMSWPPPKWLVLDNGIDPRAAKQTDEPEQIFRRISMERLADGVSRVADYSKENGK